MSYTCIYMYVNIYIHRCIHIYICIYIHIYICIHTYISVYLCLNTYILIFICTFFFRSYIFDDMITYHQNNKINETAPIPVTGSPDRLSVKRLSVCSTSNYNAKTDQNNKCRLCDKIIHSMEGIHEYSFRNICVLYVFILLLAW
jgi:hypothetical protein